MPTIVFLYYFSAPDCILFLIKSCIYFLYIFIIYLEGFGPP